MLSMAYSFGSGVAFALSLSSFYRGEQALGIALAVVTVLIWMLSQSERKLENHLLITPLFNQLILQQLELERLQQPVLPLPATGSAEALVSNEEMKDS